MHRPGATHRLAALHCLSATLLLLTPLAATAGSGPADLILIHGHVLTVDASDSVAQAIAIRRGLIVKTGSDAEIQALAKPNARVIDLGGRVATPGLIDTHAHIADGGVDELYGVANSAALKMAGITAATADPPSSTIDRDARGQPTGVLKEDAAMALIIRHIPPTTPEQMRAGILHIQDILHREGITAVKDPDIRQIHRDAYKALLDAGER